VAAVSIAVAVLAVTALVWVLFKGTVGPGEAVRDFYDSVHAGDCAGAWASLAPTAQQETTETAFCDAVAAGAAEIPAGIHVQSVTLLGVEGEASRAEVTMEANDVKTVWQVELIDGDWRISGLPDSGVLGAP
jgi:hypothetical protein